MILSKLLPRLALGLVLAAGLIVLGPGQGPARAQDQQSSEGAADAGQGRVERPGRSGLPLPRFVSLRAAEVNLRTGPGIRYPIDWVYRRRGLPVEIIDEFEGWRRIRDHEGTVGWVHQSMLGGRRYGVVLGEIRILRREPESAAAGVAQLQPGVIGRLEGCENGWCRLEVKGHSGWLERTALYGLYPNEALN